MGTATRVQTLDEAVCISHSANAPGKGMYFTSHLKLMVNSRAEWLFNLAMSTNQREGKLWIQTRFTLL